MPNHHAYNRELWEVNDLFIEHPERKHEKNHNPFVEYTVSNWDGFQFDNARPPKKMIEFVAGFMRQLNTTPSELSKVEDVCEDILHRIEYEDPYFFLVDMMVSMSRKELAHTYRNKTTGDLLDPARIETFALDRRWNFGPFWAVKHLLERPDVVGFLNGRSVPPQFASYEDAKAKLLIKISTAVWGDITWLDNIIDNILRERHDELIYRSHFGERVTSRTVEIDRLFWLAGALGAVTWLKGPHAIPFLVQHHMIYYELLELNDDGTVSPIEGTRDEAVVDGTAVYTLNDLDLLPNVKPDTCMGCGVSLHCTKLINVTALKHSQCSCGRPVDPMEVGDDTTYHNRHACLDYNEKHPRRTGFVCQRCIFKTINALPEPLKCGRAICPALNCPHHMGPAARLAALTHQRTKQLTAPSRG
jgi:hypothetical protein